MGLLFMMQSNLNQAKSQKNIKFNTDFQNLAREIQMALGDSASCTVTFSDLSHIYQVDPNSTPPVPLTIPPGQGIYFSQKGTGSNSLQRGRAVLTVKPPDSNGTIANSASGIQITKLQLQDWSGVVPNYFANLFIEAQKYPLGSSPTALGGRLVETKLPLRFITDASGKIVTCGDQPLLSLPSFTIPLPTSSPVSGNSTVPPILAPPPAPSTPQAPQIPPSSPQVPADLGKSILTPDEEKQVQDLMQKALDGMVNPPIEKPE